jgi:hypothetical protein
VFSRAEAQPTRLDFPVVFVSRALGPEPVAASRRSTVETARRSRLAVLDPDGSVRVLVDAAAGTHPAAPLDVLDPDVSYDASRIVFAGLDPAELAWRIYEVGVGGTGLRRLTGAAPEQDLSRHGAAAALLHGSDDLDPCYLPDGRICFVSTRYPGIAPDGRLRATNLYVANADGSDVHRITSERFGADTPVVEPATGRIVYSRWWRSGSGQIEPGNPPAPPVPPGSPGYYAPREDPGGGGPGNQTTSTRATPAVRSVPPATFPGVNSWFLAAIDPDGTGMAMYSGFRLNRELTQAWRPSFLQDGSVAVLFIRQSPFLGFPVPSGLRRFTQGAVAPVNFGGPSTFAAAEPPPVPWVYASAAGLPDGRILAAASRIDASVEWGLYVQDASETEPELVFDAPGTAELDAVPLVARPLPPVIRDDASRRLSDVVHQSVEEAFARGGSFVFRVENIFFNAPAGVEVANAPPFVSGMTIEFYANPQRTRPDTADAPLLVRRLTLPPTGTVETTLPAGVPLFEVLRLPSGDIPAGRDGQIFHVGGHNFGSAGTTARCVGCHAGHSLLRTPEDTTWTNLAPAAEITVSSSRLSAASPLAFRPDNLVDRNLAAAPEAEWAASTPDGTATIELRWGNSIRARELVLYAPRPRTGNDQTIHTFLVTTSESGTPQRRTVRQPVRPEGTRVQLDGTVPMTSLLLIIPGHGVSGLYEGDGDPALAEIEVIATNDLDVPQAGFVRGDVDCDGVLQISDPLSLLNVLFRGAGPLCCEAAADGDASGALTLSDTIFVLNFLYRGAAAPSSPFPTCRMALLDGLGCERQACPNGA